MERSDSRDLVYNFIEINAFFAVGLRPFPADPRDVRLLVKVGVLRLVLLLGTFDLPHHFRDEVVAPVRGEGPLYQLLVLAQLLDEPLAFPLLPLAPPLLLPCPLFPVLKLLPLLFVLAEVLVKLELLEVLVVSLHLFRVALHLLDHFRLHFEHHREIFLVDSSQHSCVDLRGLLCLIHKRLRFGLRISERLLPLSLLLLIQRFIKRLLFLPLLLRNKCHLLLDL